MKKLMSFLFFVFLLVFGITFFSKDDYRKIDWIHPDVLEGPIQTDIQDKETFSFVRNDYEYELTPLYDYELNGLIVHKMDYTWFSIYKRDSVFPMDLCVIWGDNTANKYYQSEDIEFSQDMRFCYYRWHGDVQFNTDEVANNHLVVKSDIVIEKLKELNAGDQVKIKGKLVNVKAENVGEPGKYDPEKFEWDSSTTRADSGGGACETIFLEDIEVLEKGNPVANDLYKYSSYGLVVLVGLWFLKFIFNLFRPI
jgi:hypothetical protein